MLPHQQEGHNSLLPYQGSAEFDNICDVVRKSFHVPKVTAAPKMAFLQKVSAQVKADPSVMYDKVKAIFLMSVS